MHRSIDDVCKNWTGSSIIKCPRSEAIKLVIFVHLEVLILFGYLTLLFWALRDATQMTASIVALMVYDTCLNRSLLVLWYRRSTWDAFVLF